MSLRPEQLIKLLISEAFQHRMAFVTTFILISLAIVGVGIMWPKGYAASTIIVVDDKKVIQPLMQGAAVATEVADHARLAREVIVGRKIMNQVLEYGGWMKNNPSPTEQDRIIDKITKRTTITNVGKDVVKIEYKDDDPQRTLKVTQKFAELFISESLGAKMAESKAAFDFIDQQTEQYHDKLVKAEQLLKNFQSENLDARPGSDVDIGTRLNQLQQKIEQASLDLKEAQVKKISLQKQLSGEAEVVNVLSRENQYRTRIAELQSRLETLRLSYHDTYPDIIQIKHQIEDLNQAIDEDRQRRDAAKITGKITIDDSVVNNPMYQQLKQELSNTEVNIEMLNARITEAKRELQGELERGKRVHGGEATMAELTRDYNVNRDIYQDLLRRRENARVSMNLDTEKQGLSIKIQEPATLPRQPSGLRFIHFVIGGPLVGVVLPLLMLYAKLQWDPRVRIGTAIRDKHKLPLYAVVPHLWSPSETQLLRREVGWLAMATSSTVLIIAATVVLRVMKLF